MQSLRQYRQLGQQLRQRYVAKEDGSMVLSTTQLENSQQLEKGDLEKGITTRTPSLKNGKDKAGRTSTLSLSLCPDLPLSSTRCSDGTTITLVRCVSGMSVQDLSKPGSPESRVFVVEPGDEDADMSARKWGLSLKLWATLLIYFHGSVVGIASSIDSAALNRERAAFDAKEVIQSLTVGLFLIGFGFGALFAGPLSERFGRNPVFIGSWAFYLICITGSSLSLHPGVQLSFRFMAGFFGSAPLTCGGISIGDIWSPMQRIYTFPIFANAAIMGPVLGPVFGGYIGAATDMSWRWTEWADLSVAGIVLCLILLTQRETFAPMFLQWKARHFRIIKGDKRYQTEATISRERFRTRLWRVIRRPFQISAQEPILLLLTCWLTFIWILMFTFLSGYKHIFGRMGGIHSTSEGQTGLCFAGIAVGLLIHTATVPLVALRLRRDDHKARQQGLDGILPESRLWYALVSAPAVPVALFWMAWTSKSSISIWSPLGASVLLGYGMLGVFTSSYEYIIHAYGTSSGPALSFNTFTRYIIAGIMVEVAPSMWQNPGVQWTLAGLGCVGIVLVLVLYVLFWWGPRIRARSQYAAG